jgi:Xaa-Pro aminopeptidase
MNSKLLSLHERLPRLGVDALLFNTSEIVSSTNLRYLSGFSGSDAAMLVTRTERHLFTDGRYKTQAGQEARGFRVHVVRNKLDSLSRAISSKHAIGVESSRSSYEFMAQLKEGFGTEVHPPKTRFVEGFASAKRLRKERSERQRLPLRRVAK